MACALWWKDDRSITRFEVLETYEQAVRRNARLKLVYTILGIQHDDGTLVAAADIPAPPPVDRASRERDGERIVEPRTPIVVIDPFTSTRTRAWDAPEWIQRESREATR